MIPRAILVGLCVVLTPAAGYASGWAHGLFRSLDHDFGNVPRGSQVTHQFVLTNTTGKDVRIKGVRTSCNCTQASHSDRRIGPGESSIVTAVMDTSGFQGAKSVTVYVKLDRPRRAEVGLRVSCVSVANIASAVNEVDFGIVASGAGSEKKLQLNHVGADWKITAVDYGNPHLHAEVAEISRTGSDVRYELTIVLDKGTPAGRLEDRIRLHTNDEKAPHVLVDVIAKVEADMEIAPRTLPLRGAGAGAEVTHSFVIKAQEPFRIVGVEKSEIEVQVRTSPTPRSTQLAVITFTMPQDAESLPSDIELLTDLEGRTVTIPFER